MLGLIRVSPKNNVKQTDNNWDDVFQEDEDTEVTDVDYDNALNDVSKEYGIRNTNYGRDEESPDDL